MQPPYKLDEPRAIHRKRRGSSYHEERLEAHAAADGGRCWCRLALLCQTHWLDGGWGRHPFPRRRRPAPLQVRLHSIQRHQQVFCKARNKFYASCSLTTLMYNQVSNRGSNIPFLEFACKNPLKKQMQTWHANLIACVSKYIIIIIFITTDKKK